MDGKQGVGRVLVAQLEKRPAHALDRVRESRKVGVAGTGDGSGQGGRVTVLVLHEPPEIRLDVDHHRSAVRADLLHQHREVGPVPLHGADSRDLGQLGALVAGKTGIIECAVLSLM